MDAYLSDSDRSRLVITVRGEIDLASSGELLDRLVALTCRTTSPIVLDLSQVTFMDCAGLHVLAAIDHRVRTDGGTIRVSAASPAVARLFELAGSLTAPHMRPDAEILEPAPSMP